MIWAPISRRCAGRDRLDRSLGAHRHELGCVNNAVARRQPAPAGSGARVVRKQREAFGHEPAEPLCRSARMQPVSVPGRRPRARRRPSGCPPRGAAGSPDHAGRSKRACPRQQVAQRHEDERPLPQARMRQDLSAAPGASSPSYSSRSRSSGRGPQRISRSRRRPAAASSACSTVQQRLRGERGLHAGHEVQERAAGRARRPARFRTQPSARQPGCRARRRGRRAPARMVPQRSPEIAADPDEGLLGCGIGPIGPIGPMPSPVRLMLHRHAGADEVDRRIEFGHLHLDGLHLPEPCEQLGRDRFGQRLDQAPRRARP